MRFHYLVRGACLIDGRLLLAREIGASNTFLPGGHVEIGEGAEDALAREIREELGLDADVKRHLGAMEHRWPEGSPDNHEVSLFFEVEIPGIDVGANPTSLEAHLEFLWADVGSLASLDLRPAPLRDRLARSIESGRPFWASTMARRVPDRS